MNLFIIPSWYPLPRQPIAGCFTQEQARYFAELNPSDQVVVSVANGQGEYSLPIRRPKILADTIIRYLSAPAVQRNDLRHFHELTRPVLEWSEALGGNLRGIVRAHYKNLREATSRFGKIDLIHAHVSYPAGWAAMKLSGRTGIPFVLTEHMSPFPVDIPKYIQRGRLTHWLREPLQAAAAIIAVSPSLADRICSFGLPMPRVIPNVVDERRYQITRRNSAGRLFTFFTLCGMSPQKGIPDLLQAIRLAIADEPELHFRIGGTGEYLNEYKRLSEEFGISAAVEWLGAVKREDAPELFMQSDAFIMVSHHETFGVVYAEAIACGLPVIATRCGGPEFIVNRNSGVLVEVGNIAEIARAILEVYREHEKFDAKVIREEFMARFSRKAVIDQLAKCYGDVLSMNAGTEGRE